MCSFWGPVWRVAVPTLLSRMFAAAVMIGLAMGKKEFPPPALALCFYLGWGRRPAHPFVLPFQTGRKRPVCAGKGAGHQHCVRVRTVQIAANGVANSIDQIAIMVVNAVNLAMVLVVGQCVEPPITPRRNAIQKLMKISYLSTGLLGAAVAVLLPVLLPVYQLSTDTLRLAALLILTHNLLALAPIPLPSIWPTVCGRRGCAIYHEGGGGGSRPLVRLGPGVGGGGGRGAGPLWGGGGDGHGLAGPVRRFCAPI